MERLILWGTSKCMALYCFACQFSKMANFKATQYRNRRDGALQIQSYFFRTKVVKILIILRTGAKKSSTSSREQCFGKIPAKCCTEIRKSIVLQYCIKIYFHTHFKLYNSLKILYFSPYITVHWCDNSSLHKPENSYFCLNFFHFLT